MKFLFLFFLAFFIFAYFIDLISASTQPGSTVKVRKFFVINLINAKLNFLVFSQQSSRLLAATFTDDDNTVSDITLSAKSPSVQSQESVAHKDLFPFDWSDIFGTVLVTLGILIAASGGIGGQI